MTRFFVAQGIIRRSAMKLCTRHVSTLLPREEN